MNHAQKIISESNLMKQELNDINTKINSTIHILTIPTMPNYQSFTMITEFINSHPNIQLLLKEAESNSLFSNLSDNQCDIIFARTFNFNNDKFEELPMETDKFVAVLPRDHKSANKKEIELSALNTERFLILGPSTNLYEPVISLANQAGFDPQITYKGSRTDLIVQMVEKGVGVSILTEKTISAFKNKNIAILPLKHSIDSKLSFFRKKGQHSDANNRFWEYIRENHSISE
ncbi:LysR family transcriptional regulator substrate-binding protein [Companilactobacillus baiquanensis]|nr:LysR family transcriptional regulator substrate-binding protein [Companilactobacillus baiquanensis]